MSTAVETTRPWWTHIWGFALIAALALPSCSSADSVAEAPSSPAAATEVTVVATEPTGEVVSILPTPSATPTLNPTPLPTVQAPIIDPLSPTVDPASTPAAIVTPTISDDAIMGAAFNLSLCRDVGICVSVEESTLIGLQACEELEQLAPETMDELRTYVVDSVAGLSQEKALEQAQIYGAAIIGFCPRYEPLLPPEG